MAKKLKRMEATCLDANPLTRLPGGMAIESLLRRRLERRWPLAFCLLDLDNFKAFGDKYGYARGSEVLVALAKIIEEVVAKKGSDADFLGHIGGDDFVLITTPGRYEGLCSTIIERFDALVPEFYDPEDRDRGFITGKTRQGHPAEFPLLSISIAVVTNPDFRFKDPIELGEVAAQLKDRAKSISGSVYVTDGEWRAELNVPGEPPS
jgi:GGDEF domain-containing protein